MLITVNMEQCILCGFCEALGNGIFRQNRTIEVDHGLANKDADRVRTVEIGCPMQCIKVDYDAK